MMTRCVASRLLVAIPRCLPSRSPSCCAQHVAGFAGQLCDDGEVCAGGGVGLTAALFPALEGGERDAVGRRVRCRTSRLFLPGSAAFKIATPPLRFGDDCECANPGLGGAVSALTQF